MRTFAGKPGLAMDVDWDIFDRHQGMRLGFASLPEKEMKEVIGILEKHWPF